jgi:hypothetical protein
MQGIRFSAEQVAEFEQKARMHEGCHRGIYMARAASGRGDCGEAGSILVRLLDEFSEKLTQSWWEIENFLHTAFAAGDLELISELLSRIFSSGLRPVLRVVTGGPDKPVVRWQALAPDAALFEFPAWFFQNHSTWMALFPWIRSISLIDAYHRSPCFLPGEVNYSSDDAGIVSGLAQCSNKPEHFLIPDSSFLHTRGYDRWRRQFSDGPAWAERKPVAVWRGATTGVWDKKMAQLATCTAM